MGDNFIYVLLSYVRNKYSITYSSNWVEILKEKFVHSKHYFIPIRCAYHRSVVTFAILFYDVCVIKSNLYIIVMHLSAYN